MVACAGREFLTKLEAVEAEISATSEKTRDLQKVVPDENREEISSRIDMAVGSATLILTGKCKQFRELCHKNIAEATLLSTETTSVDSSTTPPKDGTQEGGQFPTTRDDLEGFWDMISLPIQKVRDEFAAIERLKETGWQVIDEKEQLAKEKAGATSASLKGQGVPRKKPLASKNDNNVPSPADVERRERIARQKEEARQRLLEFKKAARSKITQNGGAVDVAAE